MSLELWGKLLPTLKTSLGLACVLGLPLAFFALVPPFEGRWAPHVKDNAGPERESL